MSDKYATFAEKLQAVRKQQGMSVEEAAKRAGITVAEWERFETADNRIGRVPMLWVLAAALDVDVIDLIDNAKKKTKEQADAGIKP
jgi:transcriptional regulator with XRE-family HTH domain